MRLMCSRSRLIYAKFIGSTSTVSLILLEILRLFKVFANSFWGINSLLDLINNLVLNFFLTLKIGESTGPKISKLFKSSSFFLISCAPLKLFSWDEEEIIIAISWENGGSLYQRIWKNIIQWKLHGYLLAIIVQKS